MNKTDDVKEVENNSHENETDENLEEANKQTQLKNDMTKKFCTDLNSATVSIQNVANIAKLIAELSKTRKFLLFCNQCS